MIGMVIITMMTTTMEVITRTRINQRRNRTIIMRWESQHALSLFRI